MNDPRFAPEHGPVGCVPHLATPDSMTRYALSAKFGASPVASACSNAVATRFKGVFPDSFVTVDSLPLLP